MDSGYFILKDDKVIGGVFIKPNFMTDLFVVPPYNDYEYIGDKLLNYLKEISDKDRRIEILEVLEEFVPYYESRGCSAFETSYWMIRPTEHMDSTVPEGYEAKPVTEEYVNKVVDVILSAYKANPTIASTFSREDYIQSLENFIKNYRDNTAIYDSSRLVIHKATNVIVGVCLHMEFEDLPLITNFAVMPGCQGSGIGSYLIKHSINSTNTAYPAIRLCVYEGNPAIKMYEHFGFIKNKPLSDMYLTV
jgi:GNAT superfamily N-acetyltransferase